VTWFPAGGNRRVPWEAFSAPRRGAGDTCQQTGLVKLGHVALDGTKMKANASKHMAMSYERMRKQEAELAQKVEELLRAADQADADEEARYGKDTSPRSDHCGRACRPEHRRLGCLASELAGRRREPGVVDLLRALGAGVRRRPPRADTLLPRRANPFLRGGEHAPRPHRDHHCRCRLLRRRALPVAWRGEALIRSLRASVSGRRRTPAQGGLAASISTACSLALL
jgi:hypothetical protein